MNLSPETVANLKVGTVILDRNFIFPDGEIKSKYFIILSNLIEDNYVYALTTSKTRTYRNSLHDVCKITDPVFPIETIVEINRTSLMSIKKIKGKSVNLEIKGILKQDNIALIHEMISESNYIEGYIKDIIIDMICGE